MTVICSCNHNSGNTIEDKPLGCNIVSSEVLGGNYTAADLKLYRIVDSQDEVWDMYLRCVGQLPDSLLITVSEQGIISTHASDTAAFAEHSRNICNQMCNDANEYIALWQPFQVDGDTIFELVMMNRKPLPAGGNDVAEVYALESAYNGEPILNMTFNDETAKTWAKITDENIGRRIAFVFAGKVISSPMVNGKIEGGRCSVYGLSTEETCALAKVLGKE
mgnify:CR=1 FL=1